MTEQSSHELNGLLAVYKPAGITSKDVSRHIIKSTQLKNLSIGHVGTLDPFAEGVLPILLGKATRLQNFLLEIPKTYEFDIRFGSETDTLDIDGKIIKSEPASFTHESLHDAIQLLSQTTHQTPPIYSAIKFNGKPLYQYARNNKAHEIDLLSLRRPIQIHEIKLLSFNTQNHTATLVVTCSKGTYVRCLARDLAYILGTCATVTRLVRLSAAGLSHKESVHLNDIINHPIHHWSSRILSISKMPLLLDKIKISCNNSRLRLSQGIRLKWQPQDEQLANLKPGHIKLLEDNTGVIFGLGKLDFSDSELWSIHMTRGLI